MLQLSFSKLVESFMCFLYFQLSYRVCGSLTDIVVDTSRRKHLAYLMADQGTIVNPESAKNLPKQVPHDRAEGEAMLHISRIPY